MSMKNKNGNLQKIKFNLSVVFQLAEHCFMQFFYFNFSKNQLFFFVDFLFSTFNAEKVTSSNLIS